MHEKAQYPIIAFFRYDHLPEELQTVSKPFAELAVTMAAATAANAETSAGLRKLLEAKDCAVRAFHLWREEQNRLIAELPRGGIIVAKG